MASKLSKPAISKPKDKPPHPANKSMNVYFFFIFSFINLLHHPKELADFDAELLAYAFEYVE